MTSLRVLLVLDNADAGETLAALCAAWAWTFAGRTAWIGNRQRWLPLRGRG